MSDVKLYRKRIIPEECILLEDDEILYLDQEVIITKWNTIHPKKRSTMAIPVILWSAVLRSANFMIMIIS